jgi:hypothetical protein
MPVASSTTVGDVVSLSQELVEEERIRGQVRLYNVDNPDRVESDSEKFLRRTLTTDGIQKSLRILRDSLTGEDIRGTHLLRGPFGTGKSHQMLVLYHCFNNPEVARKRFGDEITDFDTALPDEATTIPVALQYSQPEELWDPFFDALDFDPGSFEAGGWPDMEEIMTAVGDQTVALFVDELERWFETLDDDKTEATKGFLQSILEAASEYDNLHFVTSVLQKESEVYGVLNREKSASINMRSEVNSRELIQHRLFDSASKDKEAARDIVDSYFEAYEASEHVNVSGDKRQKMYEAYPFHPDLLETLEEDYYAQGENQAARGMLFLLSKTVLAKHDQTDFITHADLEPRTEVEREIGTELSHLDDDVHGVCVEDIGRVEEAEIPYGQHILSTILLHSLRPGDTEMIGADQSDIIFGSYQLGDNISDIVRDLNRVSNGNTWYVHTKGEKHVIRESRTVSALINDERAGVTRDEALGNIRDAIGRIFEGGHPVVQDDDLTEVPDNKQTKAIIKADEWTAEEVETVITNGGDGREYRNTLVFVQPTESVLDSTTVEKAKDLEAALSVKRDDTIDTELQNDASERAERERQDLRERIEIKYGQIISDGDLLRDFESATPTDFSVFGIEANAEQIAQSVLADPFDIRSHVAEVAMDLLDRRDEGSVMDIYDEFLRKPGLPIPESAGTILGVIDKLKDEPILVHDNDRGFKSTFEVTSETDTLVNREHVESWSTEDIKEDLSQRLKASSVTFDDFADELQRRTDIRLVGDVATAAEQLRDEGICEFVDGREISETPQRTTLRTDVEVISAEKVRDELETTISENDRASVREVLSSLPDTVVFEEVQTTVREAVETLLEDKYLIEDSYSNELADGQNPLSITLVPTVRVSTGEEILERIREYDEGDRFSLHDVAPDADEREARTFLLKSLGNDEPEYLLENGSANPADWSTGVRFQIPGGTWGFTEFCSTPSELISAWMEKKEDGEVTDGSLRFTVPGHSSVGELGQVIDIQTSSTTIDLTVESGQPVVHVTRLFEELTEDAQDIDAQFEFKK